MEHKLNQMKNKMENQKSKEEKLKVNYNKMISFFNMIKQSMDKINYINQGNDVNFEKLLEKNFVPVFNDYQKFFGESKVN
jgi:hypothetical protein